MIYRQHRYFIIFAALAAFFLFFNLGGWGVAETSEARYAEISREMVLSGDYLNPQLLGIYHYHKPPVTYYITTFGYALFGINEFGARFFLQIAVILQLVLVYKLVIHLYHNKRMALYTAMCYFSIPILIMGGRNLTTDVFLTLFIIAAIYHWVVYIKEGKGVWNLYLYYFLMGLAFETKGPVALLYLYSFTFLYRMVLKEKFKLTIHQIIGFLLFLVIGLLWYVLIIYQKPELLHYFVLNQTVDRMASKSFHREQPFWFYIPIVLGVLFPYIIGFVARIKRIFLQGTRLDKMFIYYVGILFVIFSAFSTKRIFYILPLFWVIALLLVKALEECSFSLLKAMKISYLVLLGIFAGAFVFLYFLPLEGIVITLIPLLIVVALTITTYFVYIKYLRNNYKPQIIYGLGCTFLCIVVLSGTFFMKENHNAINSFKPIVRFIDNESTNEGKRIFAFDFMISSIPFYSDTEYFEVNYLHDTVVRETQFQDNDAWKEHHINVYLKAEADRFRELLSSGKNYVLVKKKYGIYEPFNFIKEKLPKQKDFGKWIVYYN
ncbi:dolichyl-phosphate-mannose--protein mannosyltransferase [Neptunitalea chrysea]|uniref:Dolichyl-phosphate-mannose--protein mannosyltransferase n=1 Tax=Neptunitalea chrysea TaxID=1647581 RepID=A0A9W6EUE5_9FLAO|nr:glycosyltransferase family 39 protein [Neptunitalea chrysea]GLB51217.1 dolichyl-phosphate-mannose--protein mannosyltransferase [Neptunitalea chrysea]